MRSSIETAKVDLAIRQLYGFNYTKNTVTVFLLRFDQLVINLYNSCCELSDQFFNEHVLKCQLLVVEIQPTTCLKKLTTTYGSMSAVLSPMKALVTLAMMLELFRGRPSARYTFTKKRAQGRSAGKPSGISRFLKEKVYHHCIFQPKTAS